MRMCSTFWATKKYKYGAKFCTPSFMTLMTFYRKKEGETDYL